MPDAQLAIRLDAIAYLARRRGVPGPLRRVGRPRSARSRARARDRTGRAPADADPGSRDGAGRAGPTGRGGRAAGRCDRGRAARGQRPDAGVGSPQSRVRRGAPGRGGAGVRDRRGERRPGARLRRELRLDVCRRRSSRSPRMESGNPEQAAELFVASGGGEALPLVPGGWRAKYLELLTRCWLAARPPRRGRAGGRPPRRPSRARRASASAAAWADRAAAAVALDSGDPRPPPRAGARLRRLRRRGRGCGRSRGVADAGGPRPRPGRRARSRRRGARARGRGARRGRRRSLPARGRARAGQARRTARTGARGRARRTASGVESLTERELELARLVVDRKTNPEIAAALFLSQKTVETHLRNMFRKLSVSSRVELARAVEQADRPANLSRDRAEPAPARTRSPVELGFPSS